MDSTVSMVRDRHDLPLVLMAIGCFDRQSANPLPLQPSVVKVHSKLESSRCRKSNCYLKPQESPASVVFKFKLREFLIQRNLVIPFFLRKSIDFQFVVV